MSTKRSAKSLKWNAGHSTVDVDDKRFISRWGFAVPWFSVLVSRIYAPDTGRDPHDHSRPFVSIALRGGYTEQVHTGRGWSVRRVHKRWRPYYLPRRHAHQITAVEGELVTLVFAGRWLRSFRFWTKDGPVPHEEYRK